MSGEGSRSSSKGMMGAETTSSGRGKMWRNARVRLPRSSILISFLCIILSRLSWLSISSVRILAPWSSLLLPQPILKVS